MCMVQNYNAKDLDVFVKAVKRSFQSNEEKGIVDYLLCGLSADYNYNGRLTPEIFFNYFNVTPDELSKIPDNAGIRKQYNNAVDLLFESLENNRENLVILNGPAGSGKSTFITGFQNVSKGRFAERHIKDINIRPIRFDCALDDSRYHDASMQFPMGQYITTYKKIHKEMMGCPLWREKYDYVLQRLEKLAETDYVDRGRGYAGAFVQFLKDVNITSVYESYKWVRELPDKNLEFVIRQHALALLALMIACKISTMDDEEKYLIFFDNLEMYIFHTDQPISGYAKMAKALKSLFEELPEILGDDHNVFSADGCMSHFTMALCLRTTTRESEVNYLYSDGIPNQWENNEVRVIELPTYDFAPMAIQKKLQFLQQCDDLMPYFYAVQGYVKALYDIDPDKPIEEDLATFSTRYYIPFNNHNYRIAIINLGEVSKYGAELNVLDGLLKKIGDIHDAKSYIINGKRMFALRSRYEHLREMNYLEELGIEDFGDNHKQSSARIVLNYIFFRKNGDKKRKVNFLDLKHHVPIRRSEKFEDIADVLAALGPISCNRIKEEALRKWGALVDISGVNTAQDIRITLKDAMKDDSLARKIYLDLTPAGRDYVLNESKQFEYFLFRITDSRGKPLYKPLFSYLNKEDVDDAVDAAYKVYSVIGDYIDNLYIDCTNEFGCQLKRCEMHTDEDPEMCVTMLKAFDLYSIIKLNIDYLDRYRCTLIAHLLREEQITDKKYDYVVLQRISDENERVLSVITAFLGLYDRMKLELSKRQILESNELIYDYILRRMKHIVAATNFNIIWPQFYWPHYSDGSTKEYPFSKESAGFEAVITIARQIDLFALESPVMRIFDAMKEVYKLENSN